MTERKCFHHKISQASDQATHREVESVFQGFRDPAGQRTKQPALNLMLSALWAEGWTRRFLEIPSNLNTTTLASVCEKKGAQKMRRYFAFPFRACSQQDRKCMLFKLMTGSIFGSIYTINTISVFDTVFVREPKKKLLNENSASKGRRNLVCFIPLFFFLLPCVTQYLVSSEIITTYSATR